MGSQQVLLVLPVGAAGPGLAAYPSRGWLVFLWVVLVGFLILPSFSPSTCHFAKEASPFTGLAW